MTAERWILHVGLHKTGTSALQHCFAGQRSVLLEQGILFPETGYGALKHPTSSSSSQGHNGFAHAIRDRNEQRFATLLGKLERERQLCGAGTILLSSELFSAPGCADAADWWRRHIPPQARVTVITFLRRQDYWIESYYKELLGWAKVRETRSITEFIADEGDMLLDYGARLQSWARAFGREALRTYSYDDALVGTGVVGTVLGALGCGELDQRLQVPGTGNLSLDGRLVDLLRACNRDLDLERVAKKKLTSLFLATRLDSGGGLCSIIPHGLRIQMAARYRDVNLALAREWLTGPAIRLQFPDMLEEVPMCRQVYPGLEAPR